ncbi:MAG TPA: histidinol dehydrogenase, partial [Candidatus Methanoperedenaceae archaeon]|nr:histidinol dehydrogenase [Candidatus Methanoperedenaceae archaeon]
QAEHDPDAISVLVTDSLQVARDTERAAEGMVVGWDRKTIISRALEHSFIITADTIDDCVEFANRFAPEHLELMTKEDILPMIRNAGSIFVGEYAPVSAGDYASGTNHVLPTAGYARVFSGLNVDHFMKKSSVQVITKEGLESIGDAIVALAEAEGLGAHAEAVRLRFKMHKT